MFNTAETQSFRDGLKSGGLCKYWRAKLGDELWEILERYAVSWVERGGYAGELPSHLEGVQPGARWQLSGASRLTKHYAALFARRNAMVAGATTKCHPATAAAPARPAAR